VRRFKDPGPACAGLTKNYYFAFAGAAVMPNNFSKKSHLVTKNATNKKKILANIARNTGISFVYKNYNSTANNVPFQTARKCRHTGLRRGDDKGKERYIIGS